MKLRNATTVCTLGPASNTKETIKELVLAGLGGARINFSHGDHKSHGETIDKIKAVSKELNINIPIILDTKGPEIRTLVMKNDSVTVKEGQTFVFTTDEVEGDENRVGVTYKDLTKDLCVGERVFVDDGLIGMIVEEVNGTEVICKVLNTGLIGSRKGINLPDTIVKLPVLTEKDIADLKFGVEKDVDYIFASFVRNKEDVKEIRKVLKGFGGENIEIISKIENREGIDKMDEIIKETDGVCVARGDLGIEIPVEEIPEAQKKLITKCNEAGVFCIVATQMLESMITNPRPTRAEICDVSNAIIDGANSVMLSGETAKGNYPVKALETMVSIISRTEGNIDYTTFSKKNTAELLKNTVLENTAQGVFSISQGESIKVITIVTETTDIVKVIARLKPNARILVLTTNKKVARQCKLIWGVSTKLISTISTDLVKLASKEIASLNLLENNDSFITVSNFNNTTSILLG